MGLKKCFFRGIILSAAVLFFGCGNPASSKSDIDMSCVSGEFVQTGIKKYNSLNIYQVMVSAFQDGDSSIGYTAAYGPSGQTTGGDLQGIINSLDYIKSLGMNAIWMTPVFDSNAEANDKLASTGYYAYDYFNVDPHFGTNEKLKELIDLCHEKGMYVFLDGVFGHWSGKGIAPSPSGVSPKRSNGQYNACDYPDSLEFFEEVINYWTENYKIDGWRLDQCYQAGLGENGSGKDSYTGGHNYWYELRKTVEEASSKNTGKWGTLGYMVGEHWNGNASYIQSGSVNPGTADGYGLTSCFDFPSYYRIMNSLATEPKDYKKNVSSSKLSLGTALSYVFQTPAQKGYSHPDGYVPNLFTGNHDLMRFGNLVNWKYDYTPSDKDYWKLHKLSFAIQAAFTGPVTVYYGSEWGAYVDGYKGRGNLGAYGDNVSRTSGKISGFSEAEQDLIDYVSKLMKIRSEYSCLYNGDANILYKSENVFVVSKYDSENAVIFAINNGNSEYILNGVSGLELISENQVENPVLEPNSIMFIKIN